MINIIKKIIPTSIKKFLKKSKVVKSFITSIQVNSFKPEWLEIQSGPLSGRSIFLAKKSGLKTMYKGDHDIDQIEIIEREINLKGQTIFDIGSHIGYMSMVFAEISGKNGKVISFEPNKYNLERFEKILEKNEDLGKKIEIVNSAASYEDGMEKFLFSRNIDGGISSGSFITHADTFMTRDRYDLFEEVEVKICPIQNYIDIHNPALIKIDIEGFEGELIKNLKETLRTKKPALVIEIHSILNMYNVITSLKEINYETKIIKKESDGRCTILAK